MSQVWQKATERSVWGPGGLGNRVDWSRLERRLPGWDGERHPHGPLSSWPPLVTLMAPCHLGLPWSPWPFLVITAFVPCHPAPLVILTALFTAPGCLWSECALGSASLRWSS